MKETLHSRYGKFRVILLQPTEEPVKLILVLASLLGTTTAIADFINTEHCAVPANETFVTQSDFSWGMTRQQILEKETEIYESGKRLKARAHLNTEGQLVMPIDVFNKGTVTFKLTDRFVKSVIKHVEEGMKRGYVDALVFADMGHSHFFIPTEFYEKELAPLDVSQRDLMYEKMLAHPGLKVLYHTAEQMKMMDEDKKLLDDRKIQWRFYTRNLVGDNQALGKIELLHEMDSSHNTARKYDDKHKYWGAGFNISIAKNGCFAFKRNGETYYFDLSLKDLEYIPTGDNSWEF
jgi:hypothetical protein